MDGTQVENVFVRWLIDKQTGAENFAMRRFEIKSGTKVALHNHPEEHENRTSAKCDDEQECTKIGHR